jgi:uncharacterized membrane protein YfcA
MDALLAAAFGFVVGVALGALGGGGSILAVPALVYGLGMPVREAVPTALLVVGVTAALGAVLHARSGRVSLRTALPFAAAGVLGSVAGAWTHHRLSEALVLGGLALMMVAVAVAMLRRSARERRAEPRRVPAGGSAERPIRLRGRASGARIVSSGVGVGFLTGLFGVGGGFLIVPAMVLSLGVPVAWAVGTSLVVIAVNSGAALAAHLAAGSIALGTAVVFTGGSLTGAVVGERLARSASAWRLSAWFSYLVIAIGLLVLVEVVLSEM